MLTSCAKRHADLTVICTTNCLNCKTQVCRLCGPQQTPRKCMKPGWARFHPYAADWHWVADVFSRFFLLFCFTFYLCFARPVFRRSTGRWKHTSFNLMPLLVCVYIYIYMLAVGPITWPHFKAWRANNLATFVSLPFCFSKIFFLLSAGRMRFLKKK